MKRLLALLFALFVTCAPGAFAQLTRQQKIADFKNLVANYDKNYAPYDWKVKAFDFDLLKLRPWLDQINASNDDLSFYDICVRYVASLQDSHDEFILPSDYEAFLPFTADIYDGRVLIDAIDRTVLDPQTYPFAVGDELLAVDGKSVGQWIAELQPYTVNGSGNPFSRNRLAVAAMLDRYQGFYTFASKTRPGDTATIVVRSGNKIASYSLSWEGGGIPLFHEGPVPNPRGQVFGSAAFSTQPGSPEAPVHHSMKEAGRLAGNPWGSWTGARPAPKAPTLSQPLKRIRARSKSSNLKANHDLAGGLEPFDSFVPLFNPPPGFRLRLGAGAADEFLTGTFPVAGRTMGFIRIPSFEPLDENNALAQFQNEITFFQQNTSGLVIDLMGNGGGDLCYANELVRFLAPNGFEPLHWSIRATERWVLDFEPILFFEEAIGNQQGVTLVSQIINSFEKALAKNRGMTPPIPVFGPLTCTGFGTLTYAPATDDAGNNVAYTKPVVLLTDNFTLSAAESFSATLQDFNRVTVYGTRTDGGGGDVVEGDYFPAPYSEGSIRVTLGLEVRNRLVFVPGLPPAPYIENLGVQPDVFANFATKQNLLTGGQPFVAGFEAVVANLTKGAN